MSNKAKNLDIKNHAYYFSNDIINLKNFDLNNIKIDEKSCKDILIYDIGYVTIKDSKYVKINTVNCLEKNNSIFQTTRFNHTMNFFKLTD